MHASLHSTGKVTFATTTSLDLGFDDKSFGVVEGLGDAKGLGSGASDSSLLDIDPVGAHELLRMELVEVKVALRVVRQGRHSIHLRSRQESRPLHQTL